MCSSAPTLGLLLLLALGTRRTTAGLPARAHAVQLPPLPVLVLVHGPARRSGLGVRGGAMSAMSHSMLSLGEGADEPNNTRVGQRLWSHQPRHCHTPSPGASRTYLFRFRRTLSAHSCSSCRRMPCCCCGAWMAGASGCRVAAARPWLRLAGCCRAAAAAAALAHCGKPANRSRGVWQRT